MNRVIIDPLANDEARALAREAKVKATEEAKANWDNAQWQKDMAQALGDAIYRGFEHEDLLSLFAEVERVPYEGRSFVKQARGLKAFWVAKGGYIEASNIQSDVMEIPRDTVGFHVYEFEDKLRYGFGESIQDLINLGAQRMDAQINAHVFNLFQAAVPTSSAYYSTGSGINLTTLNSAITRIQDESGSSEVAIIGRITMINLIQEALMTSSVPQAFLPETNEDLIRRGVLANYRGARIVPLRNYDDDTRTPFFPANELWVVGPGASKFAFFGGPQSWQWTDPGDEYVHYKTRMDFGGTVIRPERLHRFVSTSIAAYTTKGF
jgi:hypothetical protein